MNKTTLTLAFAASLFALPALTSPGAAQHPGHGAHQPAAPAAAPAQSEGQATPDAGQMRHGGMHRGGMHQGMMQGAGEGAPQGMGMMNCPMMQAMMGGQGHGSAAAMGDQSVASLALNAVNEKMHREMMMAFTGNPDVDFVRGMIAHHQGAIDMAKVVQAFGEDAEIRELAEAIIEAQEGEIAMMREWLERNDPQ
jgi:uncharacterized protein (DUF305 family)